MAKPFLDPVRRHILRNSKIILTTSARLADYSDVLSRIRNKSIKILPLVLEDPHSYNSPVNELDLPNDQLKVFDLSLPTLLMLGRMTYYKGLDVVLSALQLASDEGRPLKCRILIVGVVSKDKKVQMTIKRLSSFQNVTVIDRKVSEVEKKFLLQKSEVLLFPSNLRSEAFGIVQPKLSLLVPQLCLISKQVCQRSQNTEWLRVHYL